MVQTHDKENHDDVFLGETAASLIRFLFSFSLVTTQVQNLKWKIRKSVILINVRANTREYKSLIKNTYYKLAIMTL